MPKMGYFTDYDISAGRHAANARVLGGSSMKNSARRSSVNFTKNIALIGGAAFAAAIPEPWPGSTRLDGLALPPR